MIAAVTSGRASSLRKSAVRKSAFTFFPTNFLRSSFKSQTPMKSTMGCLAATSPRNRPTRPAPTIARPMRLGCFFKGRFALGGLQGQINRKVPLSGKIRRDVDLHHHARVLGRDHDRLVGYVGAAARFPHCAIVDLRINADRLRGLEAPEEEVEVMRGFHRRGRELDAPADLLAEPARDVPAHQSAHGLADRAVANALS